MDSSMLLLISRTQFFRSEEGPTAVEYAVMLALIVVVCITAIGSVGPSREPSSRRSVPNLRAAVDHESRFSSGNDRSRRHLPFGSRPRGLHKRLLASFHRFFVMRWRSRPNRESSLKEFN